MADVAIVSRASVGAPKDYTLAANEELVLKAVRAVVDGSGAGGPFYPTLQLVAPDGTVMWEGIPANAVAAGGSADVSWFPRVAPIPGTVVVPGITAETLLVSSLTSTGTLSSGVLQSDTSYVIVVEGTFSQVNHPLDVGTPEADAMFPTSTAGRVSTQVGIDAETQFAAYSPVSTSLGHVSIFQISLDGGVTYSHIEPVGGPYSTPNTGHLYQYEVTGRGQAVGFWIKDTLYTDNYGELKVTIQVPDGTGTGSGAGSLVPATSSTNNDQILATLGGIPAWSAVDGGSA